LRILLFVANIISSQGEWRRF